MSINWDMPIGELMQDDGELYHHGVKGQKWGVRRFQKTDGSLTSAGRKQKSLNRSANKATRKGQKYVKKRNPLKVLAIISSSSAVASGALWVASAFIPGMPVLNTVAAAANLVGLATAPK